MGVPLLMAQAWRLAFPLLHGVENCRSRADATAYTDTGEVALHNTRGKAFPDRGQLLYLILHHTGDFIKFLRNTPFYTAGVLSRSFELPSASASYPTVKPWFSPLMVSKTLTTYFMHASTHTQNLLFCGAMSQLESAYTTTTYGMGKTKSLPAGVAETIP